MIDFLIGLAFVAMIVTPALAAALQRTQDQQEEGKIEQTGTALRRTGNKR